MKIKRKVRECPIIEGKIGVCIFTYNKDKQCLIECLRALERQKKNGLDLDIYIFDDGRNPIQNPPSGYHYKKTYFNRNGNLNGIQCAQGMLLEMVKVSRQSQCQYIMKVDSDMVIRDLKEFMSPLEQNIKSVIGFKLNDSMDYCAGVTYILPAEGLYKTLKEFVKWYREENKPQNFHCPEDWAITRAVAKINYFPMVQWDNTLSVSSDKWLMAPFNFKERKTDGRISPISLSRFQLYDFVNFGNRYEIQEGNPHQISAECMRKFNDFQEK